MRRLVVFLYVRRQLSGERTSVRDPEGVLVEERTHLGRALLVQKDGRYTHFASQRYLFS